MTISFQCTGCGRTLKVADELAGRKGKCPQCNAVLFIPEGKKSALTTAPAPPRKKAAPAPPAEEPEDPEEARDEADDAPAEEPRKRRGKKIKGKTAKRSLMLPLLLGGGLLFLLCAGGGTATALWWFLSGGPQDDLYFYPDNTQSVAFVKFDQLFNSGAVQSARQEFPDFDQQLNQTGGVSAGVDTANIDKMLVASAPFNGVGQSNSIVIIRTKQPVKPADVEASIQKNTPNLTFNEVKVGRFTMYEGQTPPAGPTAFGPPPLPPGFVMADDKRVVAGPAALLRLVLERDKKPDVPDKLQALLKQTNQDSTVVFVASAKDAFPRGALPVGGPPGMPAKNPFEKVDGLIVTANVASDVDVTFTATCADAQAANELRDNVKKTTDQLKGLLTLAALTGNKVPAEVSDLLDLDPQVSNATVSVTKKIPVIPLLRYAKEQQQQQQKKQPAIVPPRGK